MTPFHKVTRGKPFDHVNDKRGDKTKDQKGMGKPAIERYTKKFFVKDDVTDKNFDIPSGPNPEAFPTPAQKDF
jgi:hypothetical protein